MSEGGDRTTPSQKMSCLQYAQLTAWAKTTVTLRRVTHMLKKVSLKLGLLLAAISVTTSVAFAETQVRSSSITVSASIVGVNTLFTEIRTIAAAGEGDVATVIDFVGAESGAPEWTNLPAQYVKVAVTDNALSWRLRTYTNNFANETTISTTTWGTQYGGLKGDVDGAKASLAWLCNPTAIPNGPAVSVDGYVTPSSGTVNGWTFMKDARDEGETSSFSASDEGGYTNIAFGSPSFTRIVRPNIAGGNEALASRTAPFYYYIKADFSSAPAAEYDTTLVFELLNQ